MENGPDKLPTDESDEYDPDSADDIFVPVEYSEREIEPLIGDSKGLKRKAMVGPT